LLKAAAEIAKEMGIEWRQSTREEQIQGYKEWRWVYSGDTQWRAQPWIVKKFDPANPDPGKTYEPPKEQSSAQMAQMASAIVATVMAEMETRNRKSDGLPSIKDDPEYGDFLAFKAWKRSQETQQREILQNTDQMVSSGEIKEQDQREVFLNLAEEAGVKVDRRWGLDRIKNALAQKEE